MHGDNPAHWLTITEVAAQNRISPTRLERLMRAFNAGRPPTEYAHPERPDKFYLPAFSEALSGCEIFSVYDRLNGSRREDSDIAHRATETFSQLSGFIEETTRRSGRRANPLRKLRTEITDLYKSYGNDVPHRMLTSAYASVRADSPEYWQVETERLLSSRSIDTSPLDEQLQVIDQALQLCRRGRPKTPDKLEAFLRFAADDYLWLTGKTKLDWSRNRYPRGPFIDYLRAIYAVAAITPTYRMLRAPKAQFLHPSRSINAPKVL